MLSVLGQLLARNVKNGISEEYVVKAVNAVLTDSTTDGLRQNSANAAMDLGCVLNHPHSMCLFADTKIDRRMVNSAKHR
jgi:hypothetical protein